MEKTKQLIMVLVVAGFLVAGLTTLAGASTGKYIVQPGDSLWIIANKFNTSISTIRQLNNIWNNYILVGQVLIVPQTNRYYTVVAGDSLWLISRKFGVSIDAIKRANNLTSNYIEVGQRLIIPSTNSQVINTKPLKPIQSPTINLSNSEIDLLARLVHAEASGEPYSGKVAVAAVILNRIKSPLFPNTLAGVTYQKYAFESVETGYIWSITPDQSAYQAARDAINGSDPTNGALFFYNPDKVANPNNWIWSRKVTIKIGNHVFAI